jgi:hypothetical protein
MWPALFFSPSSHCSGSRSLYIHSGTHTLYMPSFCWQQGLTCRMSGVTCSINPRHIRGESMQHTACCAAHHTTVQLNNTHTHTHASYMVRMAQVSEHAYMPRGGVWAGRVVTIFPVVVAGRPPGRAIS